MSEWVDSLRAEIADYVRSKRNLEDAMNGLQTWFKSRQDASKKVFEAWMVPAMLAALLTGFADVQADAQTNQRRDAAATLNSISGGANQRRDAAATFANAPGPDIDASFDVKFRTAIEYWRRKGVVTPEEYQTLEDAAKSRAFTSAKFADEYALNALKESLRESIENGTTPNNWLDNLEQRFADAGLSGVPENAHYLRTVYRTNVYGAYNAGRYVQMAKVRAQRPYLEYVTVGDDHVRPEHAALDGTIKPADDPFWKLYYPPNGWNCRCLAVSLSQEELEAEGLAETSDAEITERYQQQVAGVRGMPPVEAGFDVDPAVAFGGLEDLL